MFYTPWWNGQSAQLNSIHKAVSHVLNSVQLPVQTETCYEKARKTKNKICQR